ENLRCRGTCRGTPGFYHGRTGENPMSMRSAAATVVLALFVITNEAGSPAARPGGASAEASRKSAPVRVSATVNALRLQPWNQTVANIVTSEYEYHEPTNQSRNQQFGG